MLTIQRASHIVSGLLDHAASNNNGLHLLWEHADRIHSLFLLWTEQSKITEGTVYLRLAANDNEKHNDLLMNIYIMMCSWRLLFDDVTSENIPNFLKAFNRATLLEFEITGLWDKIAHLSGTSKIEDCLLRRRIGRAQNWTKQYPTLKQWFDLLFAPPSTNSQMVVLEKTVDWTDVDYTDILAFDE